MQSTSSAPAADFSAASPAPKPSLATWLAVLSVGVGAFALVTTEFLPVGLLPQIAAELRISEGLAGLLVTMPGYIAALSALAVTIGVGKTDRRIVLLALLSLLFVSNLAVALAPNFAWVLAGRALLGVAVGGFWAVGLAVGPRLVSLQYATRANSLIFAGVSLGTVAGVPAGALLGEIMGWRVAFGAAAGVAVLVLLTQLLLLPKLPVQRGVALRDLPQLLHIPKARIGLIATLLIFVAQFAAYTYISPFLEQVTHMNAKTISALLLAYGVTGFFGNILGGWIAEKSVRGALAGTALVMGLATASLPLLGADPLAATVLVSVWGLAFGAMPISVQSWMMKSAPDAMDSGGALFVATAQVALASGAAAGGVAVDHFGLFSAMFLGGAFAAATVFVMLKFGNPRRFASRLHVVH
ncbi:MFS transporter [Massilia sp. YIM B04103]|uniref:MFS transporter n=1 Tax=Massilia sp. YIM B04103 TaxID=2963106 RepID=UPI00210893C1|nr:MFS transporter [Massilia sp. YIM B04103]